MTRRRATAVRVGVLAAAAVAAGAGLAVVAVAPPTADGLYPRCTFHAATGLHCPGCGTTRALHSLLNGRPAQAVAYNPLALVVVPVLGLVAARSLWAWAWGTHLRPLVRPPTWVPVAVGVAVGLFWVLRNVPVYPLTLLAPHEIGP